jgi:hypothetical protein
MTGDVVRALLVVQSVTADMAKDETDDDVLGDEAEMASGAAADWWWW